MRRRGITLIELLLALTISILVMMAAGNAYVVGSRTAKSLGDGRDAIARRAALESSLRELFAHAYVDADATDTSSYFVSGDSIAGKSASSTGGASSGSGDQSSVVFTLLGRRPPSTLLSSTEEFETNNEKFGPVAGSVEVQLGTSPVGSPAGSPTGLFLREQAPSDTDPTQGGTESLLSSEVESISFEYYDGTAWVTTWDTTTMTPRRLPAAVRVTYRLTGDTDDRIVVFPVPASDVTPDNPLAQAVTN